VTVAVANSASRKRKSATSGAAVTDDASKKRKSRKAPRAEEYKDVCHGDAVTNRAYLSKVLGKMFLDAGGDSRGWPGKNTDKGLAKFKLKLVIKKNKINLDLHLRNVLISRMKIDHTWRILRGLQLKLIKIVPIEEAGDGNEVDGGQSAGVEGGQSEGVVGGQGEGRGTD
jgi:hypothetical protein